jgi:hypothetical protein
MERTTYTIAEREAGSNGIFTPVAHLPLMTLETAQKVLEASTLKGQAEFVVINVAAQ